MITNQIFESALKNAARTILDVHRDDIVTWGSYLKNVPLNHVSFGDVSKMCSEQQFHYFCETLWFDEKYYTEEENHWQVRVAFKFFLYGLGYKEKSENEN